MKSISPKRKVFCIINDNDDVDDAKGELPSYSDPIEKVFQLTFKNKVLIKVVANKSPNCL